MPQYGRSACVYCGHQFRVSLQHMGEAVECPACGQFTPIGSHSIIETFEEHSTTPQAEKRQEEASGPHLLDWHEKDVILGLYEVRRMLGEGGMGKVYLAHHRGWGMEVAVKLPKPAMFSRADGVENFERECRTWANLGLHPHTVICYFVRRFGGIPLVFVEYVAGGTLAQWIRSKRLYQGSPQEVLARILDIAIQMAWGLHHAHRHGMIHRDVKPGNVMMTPQGDAKITDFGLARARALAGARSAPGETQNILVSSGEMTRGYCSPEQARGERSLTAKSDLWSWAVAVLEMFAGEVSWRGGEMAGEALEAHLSDPPDDSFLPPLPAPLAAVLRQCFSTDPGARPATMLAVAAQLKPIYRQIAGIEYGRPEPSVTGMAQNELQAANLNNRAVSMIELGQFHEVPRLLTQAAASARLQEVMYNYSLFALRFRPGAKVREMIRQIPIEPNTTRHAYYSGMLLLEAGELYEAIDVLGKALHGDDTLLADMLNARGIGLLLAGETQPAIASFEAALTRAPNRLEVLRNLALAYYYDRQPGVAATLFEELASQSVLDADDAVRYATVLSAAGSTGEARRELSRALASPGNSSFVLLTASELLHGCQTFLPGIVPLRAESREHEEWLKRVTTDEPRNLRARIDEVTLPSRYGLKPEALSRRHEKEFLTWDYLRIGGAMVATWRALTKRFRWGDLGDTARTVRLSLFSGLPALVLLLLIALAVSPGKPLLYGLALLLPIALSLTKMTPAVRLGRAAACLMLSVSVVLLLLYLILTPTPNTAEDPHYLDEAVFLFRGGTPSGISAPPAPSPASFGDLTVGFARWGRETFGLHRLAGAPLVSLGVFVGLPAILLFGVWQFMLQALTCHTRAWPPSSAGPRISLSRLAKALAHRMRHRRGRTRHDATARMEALKTSTLIVLRKLSGNLGLSAFLLLPLTMVLADEVGYRTGTSLFIWLGPAALVMFLCASLSPRFFLPSCAALTLAIVMPSVFTALGLIVTALSLEQFQVAALLLLKGILVPMGLLACSGFSIRFSPEFKAEWRSFDPKSFDIRQIVDPLNIRGFAAPWQLVQAATGRQPRAAGGPGAQIGDAGTDTGRARGASG